ncbi:MAG: DUF2333 family protein [Rhodospirillaceae bacterium]|nr:DUF2333 family protein [Rhodospirillaceae bacterium]MBT5242482.1 DUF2333 family protein [Rhodospirillaceae bacterium]MBT5566437.1 DUF2333 family protein [Rhodospirillaceae bacterium]MBT6088281.1 DUF2333 family protein [Rhodospirillaceae bacterium]MBT7450867.1 DUF2333 family protein [Rhodospirillaceae bacterium]
MDAVKTYLLDLWARVWATIKRLVARDAADTPSPLPLRIGAALLAILVIYYGVGMAWYNTIADDVEFQPTEEFAPQGGAKAVATAAALVDREARRWSPNKPWLHPAYGLDNMPNYQLGVLYSASRFAIELGDALGRTRGSSAIDPDLDRAAGLLKYDGTIWYWGSGNFVPTATADSQYREGVAALRSYNARLAAGDATYERRADNLIDLLNRVASDLGSASAALDERTLLSNAGYFDTRADDLFYNIKGRLYGYAMILRDVGADFGAVIGEKQSSGLWEQMLMSLRTAAEMDPLIVANGKQDGMFVPSHLSAQGFYLLRARTQIKELTDTLTK